MVFLKSNSKLEDSLSHLEMRISYKNKNEKERKKEKREIEDLKIELQTFSNPKVTRGKT